MIGNVVKRIWMGFGAAAVFTWVAVGILVLTETEASVTDIWVNMMGSIVIGGYFAGASYIFDHDRWSPLKQMIIHFVLSVIVFFPLALRVGWLPAEPLPLLIGLGIFIVMYMIFWFVIRMILNRQAASLNRSLKRK